MKILVAATTTKIRPGKNLIKTRVLFETRFATIAAVLLCAVALAARGDVITVTNTNDSGAGSLRQALADATDRDRIAFAVSGAIVLTSGELLVNTSVTISGPGANSLPAAAVFAYEGTRLRKSKDERSLR